MFEYSPIEQKSLAFGKGSALGCSHIPTSWLSVKYLHWLHVTTSFCIDKSSVYCVMHAYIFDTTIIRVYIDRLTYFGLKRYMLKKYNVGLPLPIRRYVHIYH